MRRLSLVAVTLLGLGACGSNVPHDRIVAAASSINAAPPAATAATTAAGPGPATPETVAAPGSPAGDPTGSAEVGPGGSVPAVPGRPAPAAGRPGGQPARPAANGAGAGTGTQTAAGGAGSATTTSAPRGATPGPAAGQPRPANLSPVKLGHIGTYSGVLGSIFAGGRETAQVWAASVNTRGGLNGHPVEIVVADDGADPARALSIARDMVETRGVIAFVGNIQPLSVSGVRGYLEERRIPVAGADGAIDVWWQSPVFFPALGYIETGIIGGADVAVKAGKKRVGIVYCGEATACTNAAKYMGNGGAESVGAELVYTAQVSLAQPDFTSECIQARDAKVEALVGALDGNSMSRMARSCLQQGFRPQFVSYGLALIDSIQKDANLEGMIGVSTGFPWFSDDPVLKEYRDAMRRYAPRVTLSGAAATVWGGGKLLEAGSKSLSAAPTSQEIIDGIGGLKNETLGGLVPPLTFTRGGLPTRSPCFYPIKLTGGRFTAPDGMRPTCIAPR